MLNNVSPFNDCAAGTSDALAAWFCVRTQPKHEHIAAAHLQRTGQVEIFHPRIRFARPTRRGPATVVESLFPNYLFARFDWHQSLNLVQYTSGISGVVHFGTNWPTIPEGVVEELRTLFGAESIRSIPSTPKVGDAVIISTGVFEGLEAVVTRVLPGGQRVAVLLHFLGRQSTVELQAVDLIRNTQDEIGRKLNFSSAPETAANGICERNV